MGEVTVQLTAGHPFVIPETVQRTLSRYEIQQRREGQERDDDQVGDGLELETEARVGVLDELPEDGGDDV